MRLFVACLAAAFSSLALAQSDYPSRAIRLVVTVPPGGAMLSPASRHMACSASSMYRK